MNNKKFAAFVLLSAIIMFGNLSSVMADDDDDDDHDDERERRRVIPAVIPVVVPEPIPVPIPAPVTTVKTEKPKIVKEPLLVQQPVMVTETILQDVILIDTDHDGIPDKQDEYPHVAQMFIVSDNNNNGIVDTFERSAN